MDLNRELKSQQWSSKTIKLSESELIRDREAVLRKLKQNTATVTSSESLNYSRIPKICT